MGIIENKRKNYHAPTGILTGPLDSRRRLIHPAVVLMKLESKLGQTWAPLNKQLTFLGEYHFEPVFRLDGP
jgi:hypothetical protein